MDLLAANAMKKAAHYAEQGRMVCVCVCVMEEACLASLSFCVFLCVPVCVETKECVDAMLGRSLLLYVTLVNEPRFCAERL